MNTLFGRLLLLFVIIITLIIVALMVSFILIYSNSYEAQIEENNEKQALYIAQSLYSFMNTAYKTVEELSYNSDVLSLDTERQTPVFVSTIERNDYFELLYAQGMDGMQTGRSSGELGNRKERWWFIQMEQTQQPFVSQSYYSVGTNMPCASVFFPMMDSGSGEMIGVMAGDIKLSALHDFVVEAADIEAGSWTFILDGTGVVVAHPDKTYQEELYNYLTLTKTITIKDEHGVPVQDAAGNLTEEQSFYVSDAYKAAIEDMILGHASSTHFIEDGVSTYLSYRPVPMDGFSDDWYVLAVRDGDVAMRERNTVITLLAISSAIIILTALLVVVFAARALSSRVKIESMAAQHEVEKAQESERTISEFLATVSHEIRTPMNTILGITQIQMMNSNLGKEQAEAFNNIHQSGTILMGIINDILDMSKIRSGEIDIKPERYDVLSFINDTVQLNMVRIGSRPIKLRVDIDENLPTVLIGDELRLKQVLNNLLSNAIKYTEKGEVKLSVKTESIITHNSSDEIFLVFSVSDTGIGMKPEDVERLFTKYLRFEAEANRTTEGTGLGLTITKRLVELMGGEITAKSDYGKGSVFTASVKQQMVECPAIGKETAKQLRSFTYTSAGSSQESQITRVPMPYGKVLVVDDMESNLYVAQGMLSPYKLTVDTATSGYTAVEKAEKGESFDIIFMDHMMPHMDGVETTIKLRAMGYEGTIIALTANALVGVDEMFLDNGFDGFIAKPVGMKELNDVLNRYIRDKHPEEDGRYKPEGTLQETGVPVTPKLLKVFKRDAAGAIAVLREAKAAGDLKHFTVAAHAMKSALANIGETELSAVASRLENAGQSGDERFIADNADGFICGLEALIERLPVEETDEQGSTREQGSDELLAQQLKIVKAACENYDDERAMAALDSLQDKRWSAETAEALDAIRDRIFLDSDFEGAAGLAEKLL